MRPASHPHTAACSLPCRCRDAANFPEMRKSRSRFNKKCVKFSWQHWGKTRTKLRVSWLGSYWVNHGWGNSTFLIHWAKSIAEEARSNPQAHPQPQLQTSAGGSLHFLPVIATIQKPPHAPSTSQNRTVDAFAQIPTSVLLIRPIVADKMGRPSVLPTGTISAPGFRLS